MKLDEFILSFQEEIEEQANRKFENREKVFVEKMSGYLSENSIVENIEPCYGRKAARGLKVNAYAFNEDEGVLSLFVADFDSIDYGKSISRTNVEKALKRVIKYYESSIKGMKIDMEESQEDYSLAQLIYEEHNKTINKVEYYLLTNSIYKANEAVFNDQNSIEYHVWDIERLYQFINEFLGEETIEIDFSRDLGSTFELMKVPSSDKTPFDCYVGYIPADLLALSYDKWGQKLIERNVRSFLQARGKVNKGIKTTLKEKSEMFVAYNNGISTVAEAAELQPVKDGINLYKVVKVQGWQIVNGGQTTASLYQGYKDNIELKDVFVQIKLTVIKSENTMDDVTAKVSEYANTQNKISLSDLKANHPILINLENISRSTWVPTQDGTKSQEKWFFERARGQYLVELNRQGTSAKKKTFQKENPKSKVLTKTQVAKYFMTWEQYPELVSKGSEANFEKFIETIEKNEISVESEFYKKIVAKGILFNECDRIVKDLDYPGYKANVVYYTIAMLSYITDKEIDFSGIWKKQAISDQVKHRLQAVAQHTWNHITNPPVAGTNVTQWCKKKECWEIYKAKAIEIKKELNLKRSVTF